METLHFGMQLKESQYVYFLNILDVLKAFDTDVTRLEYIEEIETIVSTSKGKSIKFWKLPKEWRDAKLVADEQKVIQKRVLQQNKDRV